MKRYLLLIFLSLFFWVVGTALIVHAESETVVIDDNQVLETLTRKESYWSQIYIPQIQLRAELVAGGRINNKWLGSYTRALYWQENDRTVIYGHNTTNILGKLKTINTDDLIILTAIDGKQTGYKVREVKVVVPEDYSVLNEGKADLVLITCVGKWDKDRLIVKAITL